MSVRHASVLLLIAFSCCAPQGAGLSVGDRQQPIVGGTLDLEDPGIVGIYACAGTECWDCTGTLISPRVILTAAHCADPTPTEGEIFFGSDLHRLHDGTIVDPVYQGSRTVVASARHPEWAGSPYAGADIALMAMDSPAPAGVPIVPLNRTALGDQIGQPIRLVGFGTINDAGDGFGLKRETTGTLKSYAKYLGVVGKYPVLGYGDASHNTCQGDSGGPNLMTIGGVEVVAGITSWGAGCTGASYGTDVLSHLGFIDDWVASNDPDFGCGLGDGCTAGCSAPDPDCPCADDGFCTTGCPDSDTDPDCPQGCGANGVCVATGCPAPDPDCAACGADGTCTPGCPADPDCGCTVDSDCGDGYTCQAGACVERPPQPTEGGLGAPCDTNADCASGVCAGGVYCTQPCEGTSCPAGFACSAEGYCMSATPIPPGWTGAPCGANADCFGGLCASAGNDGFCTEPCEPGGTPCPNGSACIDAGDGQFVCDRPPDAEKPSGGGCGIAHAPPGGLFLGILALAVLACFRRRPQPLR